MTITGKGHLGGNPATHCELLKLQSEDWREVEEIALLFRVLSNAPQRQRLIELAERVEAEELAAREPAPC